MFAPSGDLYVSMEAEILWEGIYAYTNRVYIYIK